MTDVQSKAIIQRHCLVKWFKNSLGACLFSMENSVLRGIWGKILGKYLLVLGDPYLKNLLNQNSNFQPVFISPDDHIHRDVSLICADYESLPIAPDSVHAVLLAHVLEFAEDPYQVLREVEIALAPEGYLILSGFNPMGIFGIRRLFSLRRRVPWSGKFRLVWRVQDWLRVLNFEIVCQKNVFYLPPVENKLVRRIFRFFEMIGRFCLPFFGGVYVVTAKKKRFGGVMREAKWEAVSNMVRDGLVRPATRGVQREQSR